MNAPVHNFGESLRRSHAASDLPLWLEIYRQAFPDMLACVDHRKDGEHQRAGIDRSIVLENSKQILVDEKIRYPSDSGKVYHDILLEYLSSDKTDALGWVCKPLRCDFICYAIAATGKAYLLPVPQLQLAWSRHGSAWRATYGEKPAKNRGYRTWNCPVPVPVLFPAIGECLRYDFTPLARAA